MCVSSIEIKRYDEIKWSLYLIIHFQVLPEKFEKKNINFQTFAMSKTLFLSEKLS